MKDFIDHLEGRGYASNTINLYVYAITQLSERVPKVTNQALLEHKDWLVATFAPKTANSRIGAINVYLDFIAYEGMRLKGIKVQQKPFLDNVITNEQYETLKDGLRAEGDWFWYHVVRTLAAVPSMMSESASGEKTMLRSCERSSESASSSSGSRM